MMIPRNRLMLVALLGGLFLLGKAAYAEIYTIYSDKGLVAGFSDVPTYGGCAATPLPQIGFDGRARDLPAPEGYESWKSTQTDVNCGGSYVGWGVGFATPQNLTRFNAGELRFWIYSSTGRVQVEIKDATATTLAVPLDSFIGNRYNQWIPIRIPFAGRLQGTGLSAVINPFLATALDSPVTFYIDHVRYVDSTASPLFQTSLKRVSDNAVASEITWNSENPSANWTLANQYIELNVDVENSVWSVQMFTDNLAPDASPAYTGLVSSFTQTPAGLIDTVATDRKLPLAWAIRPSVSTTPVIAADPNNSADPNSFQWFFMEDAGQVASPTFGANAFANGDPYITPLSHVGLHYGQSPLEFGGDVPPYRIYLQSNFGNALIPRTYQTSTLRVELYFP